MIKIEGVLIKPQDLNCLPSTSAFSYRRLATISANYSLSLALFSKVFELKSVQSSMLLSQEHYLCTGPSRASILPFIMDCRNSYLLFLIT